MMEAAAFVEYLEHHPLPHGFSRRFGTIIQIAQFVMHPENADACYMVWRISARYCHNYEDADWVAILKMVMNSPDIDAMLTAEPVDSPIRLFQSITTYINEFLLSKADRE